MTYDELVTAVSDYTENTFSTTVINTCIKQAEERVYNTVQIPALRKNVTGVVSTTTPYLSAPSDFLSSFSLAVIDTDGSYEYLLNKDVNFIRQAYPKPTDAGLPKYYALFGPTTTSGGVITDELSFILGPTPDAQYDVELHYYYYPESITVAADGRTWLGDNYDPALFYGTLVEAYTYMKGETDLIQLYNTKFSEALMQLKRLGDGLERGDAYRDGQAKVKVT